MAHQTYVIDENGVAIITWDAPGRPMNVMSPEIVTDYFHFIERAVADPAVKGVVVTSAKAAFLAGADLAWIEGVVNADTSLPEAERARQLYEENLLVPRQLRWVETSGKPVAVAINGTALGGGLEVCLACHRRFVADDSRIQLGLPESKLGLMPGAGGTTRISRMIGAEKSFPIILEGRLLNPKEALALGIVDEVVPAVELVAAATKWVLAASPDDIVKPWDRPGFVPPGPDPRCASGATFWTSATAHVRRRTYGNYPSVTAIENAVFDGLFVPMDTALKIEVRYFVQLLAGPNSRNMVRTNFLNFQKANKMARRPAAVPRREIRKLGVLGDGATDLAIARMAIKAGIEILSVPIEDAAADYDMLREADIIIGAVSEDGRIRADAIRRAEAASGRNGVFASTSSAAAIGEAAVSFGRPERFVGLHLIRNLAGPPQIVEVVPGRQTGDVALTLAMDFARQLRKTPIVMGDARGFYVDRIIAAYLDEALRLLAEGVAPALIENAGLAIGMATGPLALADDFSLPATRRMIVGLAGGGRRNAVAEGVLDALAITTARSGSGNGTGFYDHRKDAPAELWSGLSTFVVPPRKQPDVDIVKERLLTIQVLEATRCLEEKIVFEAADADVAAVIGFSFAPWTGGPLSYIDTVGVNRFVQCAERLAGQYGPRFEPPSLLRSMAANSDRFYAAAVATRPPSQVRSKSDAERVLADQPQGG